MISIIKVNALSLLLICCANAYSQSHADTLNLVSEFKEVMSFSLKPNVYCGMEIKISSSEKENSDTLHYKGEFYKNNSGIYYNSGPETFYLQDGYFIQINHSRKSIWISKTDTNKIDQMIVLPASDKQLAELFIKRYTIKKTVLNKDKARLMFSTKQQTGSGLLLTTNIILDYSITDHLPSTMEVQIGSRQMITEEQSIQFISENSGRNNTVKTIGAEKYIINEQALTIDFVNISNTIENAAKIPVWKDKLDYQPLTHEFIPKASYKEYEVTKTF